MAKSELVLTGKVQQFQRFLKSSVHTKILEEEVKKATLRNLLMLQDDIQSQIKGKKLPFKQNSKVTQLLKGKNFPLIDFGEMVNAVEVEMKNSFEGLIGYLKDSKSSHGGNLEKVIGIIQEGVTIKITPQMRRFLFAKAAERGKREEQIGKSKGVIVIPPRPFLKRTFEKKSLRTKINQNWREAVRVALKRMEAL